MKQKFAQAVRILTTPPVFSALMCTLLYVLVPGSFASLGHYLLAIVCLSLLPVLAYPVSYLIPALRRGGRKTQRNLALVFSVLGYLIGFLAAVLDGGAAMEKVVFGTYLISGATLAVCTLLHFKASGHTCGCSGPIAALSIFINPWFLVGYVLLTPICAPQNNTVITSQTRPTDSSEMSRWRVRVLATFFSRSRSCTVMP